MDNLKCVRCPLYILLLIIVKPCRLSFIMFIIQINKLRLRVFNFTKVILLQPGIEPRGNSFLMCSPLNLEKGSYSFSFLISTHFSNCSFCFLCQPLILYLSFNRGSVLRLSPLTLCSFFFRESHSL